MAINDYLGSIGFAQDEDTIWKREGTGDSRQERINDMDVWQERYDRFNQTDSQGRPVYGSTPNDFSKSVVFQGTDGRSYLQTGDSAGFAGMSADQRAALGAKESDFTYNSEHGYGTEMSLQERWAKMYQKDDILERAANNMPVIFASILTGGAASGAAGAAGYTAAASNAIGGAVGGAVAGGFSGSEAVPPRA
jgi:hypothetical protein